MKTETDYVTLELINGIIVGKYKDVFVTLDVAKEVLKTRNIYTSEKAYPMVVDCSLLRGVDKEARDFFDLPEGSAGLKATALVVKSRFNAFFVNFLIKVNLTKSPLPVKLFYNMDEANQWLEQYK